MSIAKFAAFGFLTTIFLASCGGQDTFFEPKNALGESPPVGAEMLSSDAFKTRFKDSNAGFVSKADLEKLRTLEENSRLENEATVANFAKTNPEYAHLVLDNPEEKINGYGDHFLDVPTNTGTNQVVLLGRRSRIAALASNIKVVPSKSNQLNMYTSSLDDLRAFLDEKYNKDYNFDALGLATKEAAQNFSSTALLQENTKLLNLASQFGIEKAGGLMPVYDPEDPKNERGAANQLDRDMVGACKLPSKNGIFANFDWPQKQYTSSVKQQGARGTCWGFATIAALEISVAKKTNRRTNFSEQDWAAHRFLYLQPREAGDGGDAFGLAHTAWQQGFDFAYERAWEYNKSWSQQSVESPKGSNNWHLEKTCIDYPDLCSDTNYQGHLFCTNIGIANYCAKAPKTIAQRSGYRITREPTDFWDWQRTPEYLAVSLVLRTLFGGATVLGIDANYLQPDANGFVANLEPTVKDGKKQVFLNHYVTVTGYISNETLHTKLPNAPSAGGPGYFIVKNSWGDCWGDAGYAYVPWEWVKKFSGQAIIVE